MTLGGFPYKEMIEAVECTLLAKPRYEIQEIETSVVKQHLFVDFERKIYELTNLQIAKYACIYSQNH